MEQSLAQTPEDIGALRASFFLRGADEVAKIGKLKKADVSVTTASFPIYAIKNALFKKNPSLIDERAVSLLTDVFEDVLQIKVRGLPHLRELAMMHLGKEHTLYDRTGTERVLIEKIARGVAAKLINGYSGTWL